MYGCYNAILRPIILHISLIHHNLCYRQKICCMAGHNRMKKHLQTVMCSRPMSHSWAWCHLISLPMTPAEACLKSHCLWQSKTGRETTHVKATQKIQTKLLWFSHYLLLLSIFFSFHLVYSCGMQFLKKLPLSSHFLCLLKAVH